MPIPLYPMFASEITLNQGIMVPYYLDETKDWAIDVRLDISSE